MNGTTRSPQDFRYAGEAVAPRQNWRSPASVIADGIDSMVSTGVDGRQAAATRSLSSGPFGGSKGHQIHIASLREFPLITTTRLFAIAGIFLYGLADTSAAKDAPYVEFLWSPTPPEAIARQPTIGFVLDGRQAHQVCVAARTSAAENRLLRIDVMDAASRLVSSRTHEDFRGPKRCYPAGLGAHGSAGQWTFNIYLDGALSATETIEVAKTLEEAPFYRASSIPYVLGRPNYDAEIPASEFIGRLVWVMDVNEGGTVTHVEVEIEEGVGKLMRDRAIAAGYLSQFPPDPSRATEPLKYRRELEFRPD